MELNFYMFDDVLGNIQPPLINLSRLISLETLSDGNPVSVEVTFDFNDENYYSIQSTPEECFDVAQLIEEFQATKPINFTGSFIAVTDLDNLETIDKKYSHKFSKILIKIDTICVAYKDDDGDFCLMTQEETFRVKESPQEIYQLILKNSKAWL